MSISPKFDCTSTENVWHSCRRWCRLAMLLLVGLAGLSQSHSAFGQIEPPKELVIRATPGEPNPSWDMPPSRIFGGPQPGVETPETDVPFSANTNKTIDIWTGGPDPGDYPAYWVNGNSIQDPRIAPPQISLQRNLVASDPVSIGSFGPNQFCVWDTKLVVLSEGENGQYISNAILLDGGRSRQLLFEKNSSLHTYPNLSTGEKAIEVETREYLHLIPSQSNNMAQGDPRSSEFDHPFFTNTSNAGWVELHKFDGGVLHFEMLRDGSLLHGRLRLVEDRFGSILQVTYQEDLQNINSNNLDDMWKILEVHDRFGAAYEFHYGTQQHAGRWCVQQIDALNQHGGSVQYTYGSTTDLDPHNDGKLVGVTYADGNVATYTYGLDASNNPTIAWDDPASVGVFGRKIKVHISSSTGQAQNGGFANQPTGALVKVTTHDGSETRLLVTYLTFPELLIEYGGTVMKITPGGEKRYATQAVDPCNHLEPVYASNTYGSNADLLQGRFTQVVDERGQVYHYEFDPLGFPIKKIYDKDQPYETFEAWTYGAYYNVTRYRDREGRVTRYIYNATGRLTEKQVGILDNGISDINQPEYAIRRNEYYPSGHINRFMLKTEFTPLHVTGESDVHRTDYEYDQYNRVTKITGSAEQPGLERPKTIFGYDQQDGLGRRRHVVKDPGERRVYTIFDESNRKIARNHDDGSFAAFNYGRPSQGSPVQAAQQLVSSRDRTGTLDHYSYDDEGRLKVMTQSSSAASQQGKFVTSYNYHPDSALLKNVIRDSRTTLLDYDYRARRSASHVYPRTGKTLTTTRVFLENRLHYVEDPYGRRQYVAYNENGTLTRVRVLQYNRPYDQTNPPANRTAVLALGRNTSPNPPYTIDDYQLDHSGNMIRATDGRDFPDVFTYDSRSRMRTTIEGAGVSGFHFNTVTNYNADSTISSVRSPRYYDTNDTNGHQTSEQLFYYNGRSLLSKKVVAVSGGTVVVGMGGPGPGSQTVGGNLSELEIFYHLDNRVRKYIDARDFEWITEWDEDDGRFEGRRNPLGNGQFQHTDSEGRVTHSTIVAEYDNHTNKNDPIDNKIRREVTARYDGLGRLTANTVWLTTPGAVDPNAPPIAGLDGIAKNTGLTTQYVYDTRLFDGSGLDSSGGIAVPELGTGTSWNVNIQACLARLAEPVASGGAAVAFSAGRAGEAIVTVNGEEDVAVEIKDAVGRRVMAALIEGPHGNNPNALISWTCTVHDTVTNLTGFGKTVETISVDALGNTSSRFTDGGGRLLQTKDTLGKITTIQVDADGHQLSIRDPNEVGADMTYDALGRLASRTDTYGNAITWTYDRAGNVIETRDARNKVIYHEYDAANQLIKKTNRINGVTQYTYDLTGNLESTTDAENRTTSYFNNATGVNTVITYPDHVSGSTVGQAGYGKVTLGFDAAVQLFSITDQSGAVTENRRDLAGRVTRRDYRSSAGGTIVDFDTMTYDHASRLLTGHKGRFNNTVTFAYDIAGRLESESLDIAGVTYTVGSEYDVRGLLSKLTYPDGSEVDRTYTSRGQLDQVQYQGLVYDTRTYDDGGRPETITYRNGVVTTDAWRDDASGKDDMLQSILVTHPSGITNPNDKVGNLFMAYDPNKNITWATYGSANTMYPYGFKQSKFDNEDRLYEWHRVDDNQDQSWVLSLECDWDSFTEEATTTTRSHNNVHEILSIGTDLLVHDRKGNLTQNRNGDTYSWDFDNHLTGADIDGGGNDVFFQYDVLGRRVAKTVTNDLARVYVYNGEQVLMEYDRGTAASTGYRKFLYGSYIDEPTVMFRPWNRGWAAQYYHRDSKYNVVALSWPSGKVAERYAYDAYGNVKIMSPSGGNRTKPQTDNPYLFSGRRLDLETGLYYFRARYYDPLLGRFLGRDPSGYTDGYNAYCAYMVPNYQDPSGMQSERRMDTRNGINPGYWRDRDQRRNRGSRSGSGSGSGVVVPELTWEDAGRAGAQGVTNVAEGGVNAVVGVGNLIIAIPNTVAWLVDWSDTPDHNKIRIPYIPRANFAKDKFVQNDPLHEWSTGSAELGIGLLLPGPKGAGAADDVLKGADDVVKGADDLLKGVDDLVKGADDVAKGGATVADDVARGGTILASRTGGSKFTGNLDDVIEELGEIVPDITHKFDDLGDPNLAGVFDDVDNVIKFADDIDVGVVTLADEMQHALDFAKTGLSREDIIKEIMNVHKIGENAAYGWYHRRIFTRAIKNIHEGKPGFRHLKDNIGEIYDAYLDHGGELTKKQILETPFKGLF